MSIKAVARVLEDKRTKGNDRLVLIALADYANDDGTGVYPSIPKIAAKANCEERTVERCLGKLEEMGEIEEAGRTPRGTRAWRILTGLNPDKMSGVEDPATPDKHDSGPPSSTPSTPVKHDKALIREPSTKNRQREPKQKSAGKPRSGDAFKPDESDPVDAVIVEIFEAWHSGTGKNGASKLTVSRASKIRARLKEAAKGATDPTDLQIALAHAREEVLEAVAGMVGSKWHRENEHQDFTQLFRGRDRIEFFVGRHREQLRKRPSQDGRNSAYDEHVERDEGGEEEAS